MLWKAVDDYVHGIIRDSRRKKYKIQTLGCEEEGKADVSTQFKSAITEVILSSCVRLRRFFNVKSLSVKLKNIIPDNRHNPIMALVPEYSLLGRLRIGQARMTGK